MLKIEGDDLPFVAFEQCGKLAFGLVGVLNAQLALKGKPGTMPGQAELEAWRFRRRRISHGGKLCISLPDCARDPPMRLRPTLARLLLSLLLLTTPAAAVTRFEAQVVRVKDGDSLLVERKDVKRVSEIRMAGIDAPELAQPWGIQARTAMRRLVLGKQVVIEVTDKDRYGRLVGRVWQGRTYVNAAMTRSGDAWAFDRYLTDDAIRAGQEEARKAGRGIWSLPPEQRLPPATWRMRHPRRGQ